MRRELRRLIDVDLLALLTEILAASYTDDNNLPSSVRRKILKAIEDLSSSD